MASLLRTILTYATIARKVYRQNQSLTTALCNEMSIPSDKSERIEFYTVQSAITNHWFSALRGKPVHANEQRRALLIGAITPLLDDAVDEERLTSMEILKALMIGSDDRFAIPSQMFRELSNPPDAIFLDAFKVALQAQDASIKQLEDQSLSTEELIPITATKGGSWTFLYRTVMDHKIVDGEKEAIYELGYLMQLTNDAFDVYKDLQGGQQTLFTNATDIRPLKQIYQDQITAINDRFLALPFMMKHKRAMLLAVSAIAARGLICIDQLLDCQRTSEDEFKPNEYDRKQLICDMEKPANIWKSIQLSKTMFS